MFSRKLLDACQGHPPAIAMMQGYWAELAYEHYIVRVLIYNGRVWFLSMEGVAHG